MLSLGIPVSVDMRAIRAGPIIAANLPNML